MKYHKNPSSERLTVTWEQTEGRTDRRTWRS